MKTSFDFIFGIFFLLNLSIINPFIVPQNIIFENEIIIIHNLDKFTNYYYHIIIDSKKNLPNYIQIKVNQDDEGIFLNRYFISFYQEDATFTKRKQFSNALPTSYIWLNKEQIKNGFYFSVQNIYQDCNFQIEILPKEIAELTFNYYSYSYYINQENQNMKFIIKGEKEYQPELSDKLIIYAYGNKNIGANLNISNYQKHSKYNAFIIKEEKYDEYILEINGEIGDLIDVGFLCLNSYNDCKNCKKDYGIINYGFLKRNYIYEICYERNGDFNEKLYIKSIDKINITAVTYTNNVKQCVKLYNDYDELLFTVQYFSEKLPEIKKNITDYLYIQPGFDYYQKIDENKTIGILLFKYEEDTDFITYSIKLDSIGMESKAYISIYDTSTNPNNSGLKKENEIIPIKYNLDCYTYTFNKNEIINYLNPVEHEKKILYFECIKGNKESKVCGININIFIGKKNFLDIYIKDGLYILRNVNNKLSMKNPGPFYIEILNGNVSLNYNNKFINYFNNYLLNFENEKIINMNLISKKNSLINIKYLYIKEYDYCSLVDIIGNIKGNYLFNLQKYKKYNLNFNCDSKIKSNEKTVGKTLIYTNFYPINCTLEIHYYIKKGLRRVRIEDSYNNFQEFEIPYNIYKNVMELKSPNNKIFYQNVQEVNEQNINYQIYPEQIFNNDSCLVYISSYYMNIPDYYSESAIILKENFAQIFSFNNDINILNFSYYFVEINENIKINITLLNEANYIMSLYINNKKNKKIYKFNQSQIINLSRNEIKPFCENENQICKIVFNISKISQSNESYFMEIKINNYIDDDINNNINSLKFIKMNNYQIKLVFGFFILVSIIICLGISLIKRKKEVKNEEENDTELIDIKYL